VGRFTDRSGSEGDQLVSAAQQNIARSGYVDQAVVLAMDGIVDRTTGLLDERRTQIYIPMTFSPELAKYPNLLFGPASTQPKDSIELLEWAARRAVLVKWIPRSWTSIPR